MNENVDDSRGFPIPEDDEERIEALKKYKILDTPPEKSFDRLTWLASDIIDVPIALISLMDEDRQWFKSAEGFDRDETSRECAFCNYTIAQEDVFTISDAREDSRFSDNPLVTGKPHIRSYAGFPLKGEDGYLLGTFCVLDKKPRNFTDQEMARLEVLVSEAEEHLQHRLNQRRLDKKNKTLKKTQQKLEQALRQKDDLISEINHRIKNHLQQILSLLRLQGEEISNEKIESVFDESQNRIKSILLIHELLQDTGSSDNIHMPTYIKRLTDHVFRAYESEGKEIDRVVEIEDIYMDVENAIPCGLILNELVTNAYEHGLGDRSKGRIEVRLEQQSQRKILSVSDNGEGLPETFTPDDYESLGLDLVRGLANSQLSGQFEYESNQAGGATFWIQF